jgi:hypothetical protein
MKVILIVTVMVLFFTAQTKWGSESHGLGSEASSQVAQGIKDKL